MLFELKSWLDGRVLFSIEAGSFKLALEAAVIARADLRFVDCKDQDLSSANLESANLYSANLVRANLVRANLYSANLESANLESANLESANLYSANLESANLESANLESANLVRANLVRANLYSANLESAKGVFLSIKADLWMRLTLARDEVRGLLQALKDGKVDGSQYEGECCCFVGTIAKVAHVNYQDLPLLKPDSSSPTESWFTAIRAGDTPATNDASRMTVEWIEEWLGLQPDLAPTGEVSA